ncbi:hypothetical protein T484DRAFT_1852317 [Baffinella frigidus]|nr:hypothetical protein T484DRAFT_1852317 [Cryptophyta sp. CCMP2293]
MRRSTGVLAVLAVLALKADATLAPHSSPVPRSQPPPALAFSPFLKFLPSRPHSSPSHTCSSVLRPRWTRAALLRTGKASGAVLLAAKVEADLAEAASAGNAEHLRSLLVGGADAGGADDWGCTVLHLAVKRGNQEVPAAGSA